jgi:hypothetical protein
MDHDYNNLGHDFSQLIGRATARHVFLIFQQYILPVYFIFLFNFFNICLTLCSYQNVCGILKWAEKYFSLASTFLYVLCFNQGWIENLC